MDEVYKCATCDFASASREEWNKHRSIKHNLLSLDEEEAENYKYPANEDEVFSTRRVIFDQVSDDPTILMNCSDPNFRSRVYEDDYNVKFNDVLRIMEEREVVEKEKMFSMDAL
eukprot:TRINITY_DN10648_c1_g1_i1.p1 TRINITY_DN10648_c1_g1~~TRINITY_DN10648_c1_g1_i1.p1  ORF type:complete len:132 (+),score=19.58 TRINITY_DN10648_c1_g1_i1:55-396(+)